MNKIFVHKEGKSSVVMIVAPIGSYYEDEKVKGIAHFLEHMCFKGTKTRTCKDIATAIEQYGGDLNAFTEWEITAYHATIANSYLKNAIAVIEDLVCNPTLKQKELDKERNVIIQELKMYEDNPSAKCEDLFNGQLYKKPHGLATPIIGTINTLNKINRPEMKAFYDTYYKNLTMIVVGDVENFIQIETPIPNRIVNIVNVLKREDIIIKRNDIQQAKIRIGNAVMPTVSSNGLRLFALDLMSAIYNDMSGRLFTVIREKNHLVYTVRFYYEMFSGGLIHWYVNLGLETNKIKTARKLIIEELNRPFTKKEISQAVTKTIGECEMHLDDTNYIAETIAFQTHKELSWTDLIENYSSNYKHATGYISLLQKQLRFNDNILVGIVPK